MSFFVMLLLVIGCSSAKSTSDAGAADRDGSSMQKAIIVNSVDAEYDWIRSHYPGSKVTSQALLHSGKKSYDLLSFTTESGEKKDVYFDITSFFGKF